MCVQLVESGSCILVTKWVGKRLLTSRRGEPTVTAVRVKLSLIINVKRWEDIADR